MLNLQFREAFSITLISSKQWRFTLAKGLVIFGFLKIAQQTSRVNVKDYQINPICGSSSYISHWCLKCLCGSLRTLPFQFCFFHPTCCVISFLQKITLLPKTIVSWVKRSMGRNCNPDIFKRRSNYATCCRKCKKILVWLALIYFCKYTTLERYLLS